MNRTLSNRVAERLRRLREKFGEGVRERNVDDDYDHLTSTRREHVPERTFFLGEIWLEDRYALSDRCSHSEDRAHRPALVTRRERRPGDPVETAPGRPRLVGSVETAHFDASGVTGLSASTVFALELRRPVARTTFLKHVATLNSADKQRLARALDELRNAKGASA